ncbi:hypothetical protein GE061_005677 [Apolygus lucorum]|uniref:Uncharacterized protein n=1 Tax=Apolygus lucorum TaxID=248454 RepID=A0A6A4KAY2_APOLU|nr:hypothetical protein GE061_005677 [Apolygus lucorum]
MRTFSLVCFVMVSMGFAYSAPALPSNLDVLSLILKPNLPVPLQGLPSLPSPPLPGIPAIPSLGAAPLALPQLPGAQLSQVNGLITYLSLLKAFGLL